MTKESLSIYEKRALHLNFEKESKNCEGYLEITNDALSFRSIKDGEETITIPLTQIIRARTESSIRFYGTHTWCHYLRIYYKLDNKSAEEHIVFMFQKNADIYAEEIKSKINELIQFKEPILKTAKIEKQIARETIAAIVIFILVLPLTFIFGRFMFATFLTSLQLNGIYYSAIGSVLGIIYLVGVYWIIDLIIRLIFWAVRTINKTIK